MPKIFLLIILNSVIIINAQTVSKKSIIQNVISLDFNQSKLITNALKTDNVEKNIYTALIQILHNHGQEKLKDSIKIYTINNKFLSKDQKIPYQIAKAFYRLYYYRREASTYHFIHNLYLKTKNENYLDHHKLALLSILDLYARENTFNEEEFLKYLNEYNAIGQTMAEKSWGLFYENLFLSRSVKPELDNYIKSSKEIVSFLREHEEKISMGLKSNLYGNSAIYYKVMKKYDSSRFFLNKILKFPNEPHLRKNRFTALLDIAQISLLENKITDAKKYYALAKKNIDLGDKNRSLISLYRFKAHYFHKPLKQYDSAYYLLNQSFLLGNQITYEENISKISQVNAKLNTAQKEKENLELKNKNLVSESSRRKNQNIAIGLSGSLFLGSIITILIYRNTKRKQRIAEQEREIEIQKTEKLLKEQELTTIDAMISGQEKERQRLANDLHDNLGSTLATVKLHFEHLKNNRDNPKIENREELYSKTNNLLDEAYQKVRTIAHEKNSGVMAKQGLLPAIKNLAKKASNGNGLQIEVQDYGLDERLDNALEISIFRMIQELITNAIKHAEASEINISLTNHDSLLNIIVEDNGKGFDAKVLPEKDGMGLKSIEKRIEHMEGTFEIDSSLGKGTNIIINIPI